MEKDNMTGRASALLPIGAFLVIFLGAGIVFRDFYAMPAIVAFLIALFVAFLQNRKVSFDEKIRLIAKGVGEENIITMSLIFLCAGGFSGAVKLQAGRRGQYSKSRPVPDTGAFLLCQGFLLSAVLFRFPWAHLWERSRALAPIAVGVSEEAGFPLAVCIAAVVCGAMFGDNLSMISDTTIAAVQDTGVRDEG